MTTTVELTIRGDAVVRDLPHDQYLAHPALSVSGAKLLVQPGGPARYRWRLEHPEPPRDVFDFGAAAHAMVLGVGAPIDVVHADSWRGKDAQRQRDESRAAGRTALLLADYERVESMADALRDHRVASRLLHPDSGDPEVSLFWHDDAFDVDRKGRVDWLRRADGDGRLILVDLKTCTSAAPDAVARAVANYGYALQAAWYRELVVGLGLARSVPFVFVFVEKDPPHLVHCIELDESALLMGAEMCERALRIFADSTATGVWPGLNDDGISVISLPPWALRQHDEQAAAW